MLITIEDIRMVRAVSVNIKSDDRVDPYIEEAESEWVVPALGASLYKEIEDDKTNFEVLFNGGYYTWEGCSCGDKLRKFDGLRKAIAYLTYSRFVLNHNIFTTASGMKIHQGEFSTPAPNKEVERVSNDAKAIGLKYLNGCLDYLRSIGKLESDCCGTQKIITKKYKVIGD